MRKTWLHLSVGVEEESDKGSRKGEMDYIVHGSCPRGLLPPQSIRPAPFNSKKALSHSLSSHT